MNAMTLCDAVKMINIRHAEIKKVICINFALFYFPAKVQMSLLTGLNNTGVY